jgi:ATP-dependent Clp protease ATP-binding subunit ClpB
VSFLPEALEAAAHLSARYVRDRYLPDKAFAAIDLAGSRARREGQAEVSRDDVARAVARMAGLPEERLLQPDGERFLNLEHRLGGRIVGHERIISAVARAVRRNYAGFAAQRPLASFLFCGPSGVGKTETARALADELFDGALVRIDLSEYAEAHTAARLVGAPPGYVGYGEGGQLTEAVRRRPYSVILFDEIEKAHADVFNVLLQVLDDGRLTDGHGRTVDFKNTVVIMTSNVGSHLILAYRGGDDTESYERMKSEVLDVLRQQFRPEFLNRVDEIVVFHSLSREHLKQIVEIQLERLRARLEERHITLELTDRAREYLAATGYDPSYGARPLKRAIQKELETPLGRLLLKGEVTDGRTVVADADRATSGGLKFTVKTRTDAKRDEESGPRKRASAA